MKKIFTLLSLAVVAGSVMAAPKVLDLSGKQLQIDQSKVREMTTKDVRAAKLLNDPSVITRSYVDSKGATWNLDMMLNGAWTDLGLSYIDDQTGERVEVSFEELPVYIMQVDLYGSSAGSKDINTEFLYWLAWPSNFFYYQLTGQDPNFNEDDESTYDYAPVDPAVLMDAEAYGVHKFQASSFLDAEAQKAGYYIGGFPANQDGNVIESWAMIPMQTLYGSSLSCYYNGQEITCVGPDKDGNYRSEISFVSYNEEQKDYTVADFVLYYANASGAKSNVRVNFDGDAKLRGYKQKTYDFGKVGEIHVFNAGLYDEDELEDLGYSNVETPLNRYMLFGCGEYMTIFVEDGAGAFDETNVGVAWASSSPEAARVQENVNYFHSALYLGKDDNNFGHTTFQMIPLGYEEYKGQLYPALTPVPGSFTPSAYNLEACKNDGVKFYIGGSGAFYNVESFIQFGATNGFNIGLTDSANDLWVATFDGEYVYHGDPEDMTKYEFRSTKGDAEPVTFAGVEGVVADNQKLNVVVENGQIVAPAGSMIYDMSGRRVVGNGNGIYIVRNGKQAVKVLVK